MRKTCGVRLRAIAVAVSVAWLFGMAQVVQAQVANWATLQAELGSCTGTAGSPTVTALTADIDGTGDADPELRVNCVAVVDLAGFDLTVRNVVIAPGQQLTIDDSAAVDGAFNADASGTNLAGIATTAATLIVLGGTVAATGGSDGAGIGGSSGSDGGDVVIGTGAVVTVLGGTTAVGAGSGSSVFGTLLVDGVLRLPTGPLVIPNSLPTDPEVEIEATGEVLGSVADPTVGATFTGAGQIANGGVIALSTGLLIGGGVTVSGHHYLMSFDTDGGAPIPDDVTVFAPSFAAGDRDLPAEPANGVLFFRGWTTEANGGGNPFDADSVLPGTSGDGTPVPVTVHAWWTTTPEPCTPGAELFDDVAATSPFCAWIEELARQAITAGCSASSYCPNGSATRAQMAVFLLKSFEGPGFLPQPCTPGAELFDDVAATSPFCTWIEELARRAITAGCSPSSYCANSSATRAQMAVFLLKTLEGESFVPPPCTPGAELFDDVAATSPFCAWIEELAARSVTAGCTTTSYCPNNPITRAQMAVFLLRTFPLAA